MRPYTGLGYRGRPAGLCTNENACRLGCSLPCCRPPPRRCSTSPRRPQCRFIPPPGLSTKRYCGDPCSPPPPRCTPRPERGRYSNKGRPSPRSYGQPVRPSSKSYSSCGNRSTCNRPHDSSRIEKCSTPCRPRTTTISSYTPKRDSCRAGPTFGSCGPKRPSTCPVSPSCPPRRRGGCGSSMKCPPRLPSPRYSSSCGSSFCGSPPTMSASCKGGRSGPARCNSCERDLCACLDKCSSDSTGTCSGNEEASNGPTSWFLKKTGLLGTDNAPMKPHMCPWEADVTVTGTVRGHCTSTAVEVAKRLTGKFLSHGQRYTQTDNPSCREGSRRKANQKMALGTLDDGTKLDFIRKKSSEGDDECTNNATSNATSVVAPRTKAYKFFGNGGYLEVQEPIRLSTGDVTWATAYIRSAEEDEMDTGTYFNNRERSKYNRASHERKRSGEHRRQVEPFWKSRRRGRAMTRSRTYSPSDSDTDDSSYRTASESAPGRNEIKFNRRPYAEVEATHRDYRRKRSKSFRYTSGEDRYRRNIDRSGRHSRAHTYDTRYRKTYSDDESYNDNYNPEEDEEDTIYSKRFHFIDDSDAGDPHNSPHKLSIADRCERRNTLFHKNSSRNRDDMPNERTRASQLNSKTGYLVSSTPSRPHQDSRQSSEDEVGDASNRTNISPAIDRLKIEGETAKSSMPKHTSNRKRVTYDDGL